MQQVKMKTVTQILGGNTVAHYSGNENRTLSERTAPYHYSMQILTCDSPLSISELTSYSVYLLSIEETGTVEVQGRQLRIHQGDVLQVENGKLSLSTKATQAIVLLAGVNNTKGAESITHLNEQQQKRVVKPWGFELWISGERKPYAFKKIFIKAGHKTSLQYHRLKEETNLLLQGEARLHYNKGTLTSLDQVTAADIATEPLNAVASIGVKPFTLHRIEAISDITLFETSTPHLDDVVRVLDDTKRPDGRIAAEHSHG